MYRYNAKIVCPYVRTKMLTVSGYEKYSPEPFKTTGRQIDCFIYLNIICVSLYMCGWCRSSIGYLFLSS